MSTTVAVLNNTVGAVLDNTEQIQHLKASHLTLWILLRPSSLSDITGVLQNAFGQS